MGTAAPAREYRLTQLYVVEMAERSIEEAARASRALPRLAKERDRPVFMSSLVRGPGVVIGSRQRRSRFEQSLPLVRRSTTGTAAFVPKSAIWHALALPRVSALMADATPKTLLNRNVRGFLRGYRGLGLKANWGGREYFRSVATPLGLLGYDWLADGSVLIDALIGIDATVIVSPSGSAEPGAALGEFTDADPERVADVVTRGIADKYGLEVAPLALPALEAGEPGAADLADFVELSVPIGRLEAAHDAVAGILIRGDVLASNAALDAVEKLATDALSSLRELSPELIEPLRDAPLDGATPEDVLELIRLATTRR